ncbi:MBL fold metallo-hydrolase [Pedosphaera parvula]|uniref:Beta-lactamase domain protein n=1 Tax=Pedosphaera parvula (strain Ellin514) TaxID=320771 RepID=B9XB88_PEDPL|nr:MBL fold metallo-hydrolase [Pedosphaera parvula]EEF62773.1 beta-lactamase domain protein [Pedosphaera parvula Ellin514]
MSAKLKQPGPGRVVATNVVCIPFSLVNTYMVANRDGSWVLVDAGLFYSTAKILRAADHWFRGTKPSAIVLTHGHFDHRGALKKLAAHWDAPVYAHEEEMPFLTGKEDYPAPDPTAGGGLMTLMSWMFPRRAIDISGRVQPLPANGSVPGMKEWRWIHTPGHTRGHVSFFHDKDKALIAGDAFVTVKQESLSAIISRKQQVHRPPAYFTPDWDAARRSVQELARLEPYNACTGHGIPMSGPHMLNQLQELARSFNQVAVPRHGRYVRKREQEIAAPDLQPAHAS